MPVVDFVMNLFLYFVLKIPAVGKIVKKTIPDRKLLLKDRKAKTCFYFEKKSYSENTKVLRKFQLVFMDHAIMSGWG